MKTKKGNFPEPKLKPNEVIPLETAESPEPEKVNRISIPLTAAGEIDYERMHGKTREKVKQLIGEKDKAETPALVEVFDPTWTSTLYDSIGKLEAIFAGKMLHVPPDIADKCFTYTQAEKEKLAAPTARVINKYAATWMVQFKDEIALAFLLVTVTTFKFQMASMLTTQRAAAEKMRTAAGKPPDSASTIQAEITELERMAKEEPPQA
jgi:hypothetical protein